MEPRFNPRGKGVFAACVLTLSFIFSASLKAAVSQDSSYEMSSSPVNENSSASLEMITERMKSLAGSLEAIPEPPQLNQVIQIPEGFGPPENPNTKKETKK